MVIKYNYFIFTIIIVLSIIGDRQAHAQDRPYVELKKGMQINQSYRFKKDIYNFANGIYTPIVIEGKDIVLDFSSATLIGNNSEVLPSDYQHVAIIIQNSENVRIENLIVQKFRTAVYIYNSKDIVIRNSDFSYNASLDNWLLPQHAIRSAMPDFMVGASGIHADEVKDLSINDCKISHGHHGILLNQSTGIQINKCMITHNTGFGIKLNHTTHTNIENNLIDYNFNFWDRIQLQESNFASGGVQLLGKSYNNLIRNNSITHCSRSIDCISVEYKKGESNTFILNDCSYSELGFAIKNSAVNILSNTLSHVSRGIDLKEVDKSIIEHNIFTNNKYAISLRKTRQSTIDGNLFLSSPKVLLVSHDKTGSRSDIKFINNEVRGSSSPITIDTLVSLTMNNNLLENVACMVEGPFSDLVQITSNTFLKYKGDKPASYIRRANTFSSNPQQAPILSGDTSVKRGELTDDIDITKLRPYPISGHLSKVLDRWGPYSFNYPKSVLIDDRDSALSILMAGPGNMKWSVTRAGGLRGDIASSGSYMDTIQLFPNSSEDPIFCSFDHNGQSFKTSKGEFSEVFNWDFINIKALKFTIKKLPVDKKTLTTTNAFDVQQIAKKLNDQEVIDVQYGMIPLKTPYTFMASTTEIYLPAGYYSLELNNIPEFITVKFDGKDLEGTNFNDDQRSSVHIIRSKGKTVKFVIYSFNRSVQDHIKVKLKYLSSL